MEDVALAPLPTTFSDADHKAILEEYVAADLTDKDIVNRFLVDHNVQVSARTIRRRRVLWNIHRIPSSAEKTEIDASICTYHEEGMTVAQIRHAVVIEYDYDLSRRTIIRRLQALGLQRRQDDLDLGDVEVDQVIEAVANLMHTPEGKEAGYRRMTQLLGSDFGVRIHQKKVAVILRELDPEATEIRKSHKLVRRIFHADGPNHIWSSDGHDKLKNFGITIYAFIDTWSRKVLGIFVHTTNNNPRHIGYYYLKVVEHTGGFPRRTSTDCGSETIEMAGHQMFLSYEWTQIAAEEVRKTHHYTKSTHNQKIECFWSQMMRQHNRSVIDEIYTAMESGKYDDSDPVEYMLFLYLWIPLVQRSCDKYMYNYNRSKKRTDKNSALPTGVSGNISYKFPTMFGGQECLIPLPGWAVQELIQEHYPDADQLMQITPPWFSDACQDIETSLHINTSTLTTQNVWEIFPIMLAALHDYNWPEDFDLSVDSVNFVHQNQDQLYR